MIDALANRDIGERGLYLLIALLVLVTFPHISNVSIWIIGFFLSTALLRIVSIKLPRLQPNKWLLFIMVVIGISNVIMHADLTDARKFGTALLIVMLGLKLVELNDRRDIYVCVFLSYFVVMTQFLYQQNLWLTIYLFLVTALLTSTLVNLNRVSFNAKKILSSSFFLGLAAIPMTFILFTFFPRLDSPLWSISVDQKNAVTGVSDHLQLGSISELSQSNKSAFRVRFLNDTPPPKNRYWRATVLTETDGVNWTAAHDPLPAQKITALKSSRIDYEITIEPSGQPWVYALDIASSYPDSMQLTNDYQLINNKPLNTRSIFTLSSYTNYQANDFSHRQRLAALQLPNNISPRVKQLATSWLEKYGNDQPLQVINAALNHFNQQPFVYTLSPGRASGDPIDHFLFSSQKGFCEHYSASFALLMRLSGIPARIVVGYQGGEKNPHADHWLIRQSDAHAWTEVFIHKQGWIRIDPTAAVAPERIENRIDLNRSSDSDRIVFKIGNNNFFTDLWQESRWLVDAMDLSWHRWVLGFSSQRQKNLLEKLGINNINSIQKNLAFIALLAIAMFLGYLINLTKRKPKRDSHAQLWHVLKNKIISNGLEVPNHLGPKNLLLLATQTWPDEKNELTDIFQHYIQFRYGTANSNKHFLRLKKKIRRLRLHKLNDN